MSKTSLLPASSTRVHDSYLGSLRIDFIRYGAVAGTRFRGGSYWVLAFPRRRSRIPRQSGPSTLQRNLHLPSGGAGQALHFFTTLFLVQFRIRAWSKYK